METYRQTLPSIKLWGPTFFAPVIQEVYEFITKKEKDYPLYHVLLILTDGGI